MAKLKIRGAWSGLLEDVAVDAWTVPKFREEVAMRANCSADCITLIFAGKILKDDADPVRNLASLGVKNNSKILATRISPQERLFIRVEKIRVAANEIEAKHRRRIPVEDLNREAEDPTGQLAHIGSEMELRAVMLGARLHAMAVNLIGLERYTDALEALSLGEEAFSICDPNLVELIYIVPVLHINMLWCYLMKGYERSLSNSGKRLEMARTGIERDHVKILLCPKLLEKLHLRLELLEGAVAYHSGQIEKSRKALLSAKVKYIQHLNQHEATSILIDLCYTPDEANRALQMSNGDVAGAIDFVIEEDAKEVQKFNGLNQQRFEIQEGKLYGFQSNKAVDIEKWKELVSIGFDQELAAEALGKNENDMERAFDDLILPGTNSTLQVDIESMERERLKKAIDFAIEKAVQMGFERSRVVAAFEAGGTFEDVIQRLKEQPEGPSDLSKAEEQNEEINSQINLDINISPKNEGATILFYLRLIELALRRLGETEG